MAEALVVIGLVSSIVQFVVFGNKVVDRLRDFQTDMQDVPETFQDISAQLPLLIATLKRTQQQIDAGQLSETTANALRPVVDGCLMQVTTLDGILMKALPAKEDSSWNRRLKALTSLSKDRDVRQVSLRLAGYVQTLIYHQTTVNSEARNLDPESGRAQPESYEDVKTPSQKPCFMVKYDQDTDFIGREDILGQIDSNFDAGQHRVAIAGIAGVGKSQIAIEYCYRFRRKAPNAHVFWIHASNKARFEQSYKDIATELALPYFEDPNVKPMELVAGWLNDESHLPWLLVLDNADNLETVLGLRHVQVSLSAEENATEALVKFLPRASVGSMVITTRDKRVGEGLAERRKPIAVEPFGVADAQSLLQRKLEVEESDNSESSNLVVMLDCLPLAITQATAFISENGSSLGEYEALLQAGDSETKELLSTDHYDPSRDLEIRNSVFQTWKISFDQIRTQKPRAAEILSLMAVLDRQAISLDLLHQGDQRKVDFITAIGTLKAFSLISEEKDNAAVFELHRIVQLATQIWLDTQGELMHWHQVAIQVVSRHCPISGGFEYWPAWQKVYPHVQAVLGYRAKSEASQLQRASILDTVSAYDGEQGRHGLAYARAADALGTREKLLPEDHSEYLRSINSLAEIYLHRGKYSTAELLLRRALQGREMLLGELHEDTLRTLSNFGLAVQNQGRYEEAEQILKKVLHGRESVLGDDHVETLASINHLAVLLYCQGNYKASEQMHREELARICNVRGDDHPSTLQSMNNLAWVLHDQEKYSSAEEIFRFTLDKYKELFRQENPLGLHNLASVLHKRGELSSAENLGREALRGSTKTFGESHPDSLTIKDHLATILHSQGKLVEAEEMLRHVLQERRRTLVAQQHPSTLTSRLNLARTLRAQHKFEEAEKLHQQALIGRQTVLGDKHPLTKECAEQYSSLLEEISLFHKSHN